MAQAQTSIASGYDFAPHYADVDGYKMHYIEQGQGDPIVFVHGIPTWSYLWRNIIPGMAAHGRCIAPDLLGMGRSDKPDIAYHIDDHLRYFTAFMEQLALSNITLVMHGWGSLIGLAYAKRHPEKIKALAFYEAHLQVLAAEDSAALPVEEWASILKDQDGGFDAVMNGDYFIEKVLPWGCQRRFNEDEMAHYREPFQEPGSCRPLWQYLEDLPLGQGHRSAAVQQLISEYSAALQQSSCPKLLLYAMPGFITPISTVQWAKQHLSNLTVDEIDDALHYAQESHPEEMTEKLINWYTNLA